jgi:MYXO-CTERM domain-containing protein
VKRALVLALALCLLVPAGAGAKGGVIFDRYPDVQAVGSQMRFTVMLFDRRDVRPLVTFRNSKTGEVVRTRASRSDLNGIAYGKVAFPSTGPWATAISVNGRPIFEGDAEPFRVGVGLTQTIPSADAERAADAARANATGASTPARPASDRGGSVSSDRGGSVWPWIALALLASAAAALGVHRRRRWGAA